MRQWERERMLFNQPLIQSCACLQTGEQMDTSRIIAELTAERNRLDKAITTLESVNTNHRSGRTITRTPRRGRRRLTAAGRKRLSELLKKRWASGKMGR